YTQEKARLLADKRQDPDFKHIEESFVRVLNIAKESERMSINESLFETESETELYKALLSVEDSYAKAKESRLAGESLAQLTKLAEPISLFFEKNMVMADDEACRQNRLALVGKISFLLKDFADFKVIEWKRQTT